MRIKVNLSVDENYKYTTAETTKKRLFHLSREPEKLINGSDIHPKNYSDINSCVTLLARWVDVLIIVMS